MNANQYPHGSCFDPSILNAIMEQAGKNGLSSYSPNFKSGQVSIRRGIPQKLEHNDIRWISVNEIDQYVFCPADEGIP